MLACLFVTSYAIAAETIQSNVWRFAWHTIVNPAGGYTVVQAVRRFPYIPSNEKAASKAEWQDAFEKPPAVQMSVQLHTGQNTTNGTELFFKYFRGPIYTSTNVSSPWITSATPKEKWVTVVSTVDNTRLAAGVDGGPIYYSTNSGITWETISTPGEHSLPIILGDSSCGIFATQTIQRDEQFTPTVSARNWYAVASGSDGSGVVISGSDSLSPPVLNISISDGQIIISWPSSITGYTLQENPDLTTTNWTDVTVAPSKLNGFNRVVLPADTPHAFYRLQKNLGKTGL